MVESIAVSVVRTTMYTDMYYGDYAKALDHTQARGQWLAGGRGAQTGVPQVLSSEDCEDATVKRMIES
jgi:hypothetical protein